MRKTVCVLAVPAAAFVAPLLTSGIAYAADTGVAPRGCLVTFVNQLITSDGDPAVTINGLKVTLDGGPTVAYANAQVGNTDRLVLNCLY